MKKRTNAPKGPQQLPGVLVDVLKQEKTEIKANKILMAQNDYSAAMKTFKQGRESIRSVIDSNRGGAKGQSGFVAEIFQVSGSNAMLRADGKVPLYRLLDNNGPVDYMRGDTPIQLKVYNPGNMLGLRPVLIHNEKYPDFTPSGGVYHVPKDTYSNYLRYLDMDMDIAGKLRKAEFRKWKNAKVIAETCPELRLEPMIATYGEVQAGNIENTLDAFEEKLAQKRDERIDEAVKASKATLGEAVRVTAFSAAFEGGMDGILCMADKTRQGTRISEFSKSDWNDVGVTTAKGTGKGAVRGAATYLLVNGAGIPGPAAAAGITTSFRIAEDIKDYRSEKCNDEELKSRVREHVVEGVVSAGSTLAAMAICARLIPVCTPQGKVIQICAGLAGNYLGSKGLSAVKEYII